MKKILYTIILFAFTIFMLLILLDKPQEKVDDDFLNLFDVAETQDFKLSDDYMAGVFVTTVFNLDFPSSQNLSEENIKNEIDEIIINSKNLGMTDIFFQVRPSADAFYISEIFPPSIYATGSQDVELPFDILDYFIEKTHENDMKLHAWINPYRITKLETEILSDSNPAISNPELTVLHSDGNLYFDPGLPESRELILDGVLEILENYDVDGIHFDDYFYPGTEFDDEKTYEKYGNGLSLEKFRCESVTSLIRGVYDLIDENSPDVLFGVSPFGIWANEKNNAEGSATFGLESLSAHYADTKLWVKEGIIDYIAPQLYWQIGFEVADYQILLEWWDDVILDTDVELYICHANYQETSGNFPIGEIEKQLELNAMYDVSGSIFFRYEHILLH